MSRYLYIIFDIFLGRLKISMLENWGSGFFMRRAQNIEQFLMQ